MHGRRHYRTGLEESPFCRERGEPVPASGQVHTHSLDQQSGQEESRGADSHRVGTSDCPQVTFDVHGQNLGTLLVSTRVDRVVLVSTRGIEGEKDRR